MVQNNDPIDAEDIKDVLLTVLTEVNTSPKQAERFAKKLYEQNKPYEAILFYQVAIHYCQSEKDVSTVAQCLQLCCAGTSLIVREQIEKKELSKKFVINHIVPFMKQAKRQIEKHLSFNKKEITEILAHCLHCIEQCQKEGDDLQGRESTLRTAISLLENNFGSETEKRRIYGTCLNNLGHTMLLRRRFDEAQNYFSKAIAANQKAEDHDSIAAKRRDIQLSQSGLRAARAGECPIQ